MDDGGSEDLHPIEPFPIGTEAGDPVDSMTLDAALAAFRAAGNERVGDPQALAVLTAKTCETFGVDARRKPIGALVLKACAVSFGGADILEIPPSLLFATVNRVVGARRQEMEVSAQARLCAVHAVRGGQGHW